MDLYCEDRIRCEILGNQLRLLKPLKVIRVDHAMKSGSLSPLLFVDIRSLRRLPPPLLRLPPGASFDGSLPSNSSPRRVLSALSQGLAPSNGQGWKAALRSIPMATTSCSCSQEHRLQHITLSVPRSRC